MSINEINGQTTYHKMLNCKVGLKNQYRQRRHPKLTEKIKLIKHEYDFIFPKLPTEVDLAGIGTATF